MNDEFFKQVKKFNFPKYKNAREFYGEEDYQKVREMAREIDKRLAEKGMLGNESVDENDTDLDN